MSGKIESWGALGTAWLVWVPCLVALGAAGTDLVRGKIFNWLTLPLFLSGLLSSAWRFGWIGLGGALFGIAIVALTFLPMYSMRVMGAGDVKLLLGLAAWSPWRSTIHLLLLSVLVGGVLAAFLLLLKGRFWAFYEKMKRTLLSVFVKGLVFEPPKLDRSLTFPFGIPIAIATWWVTWSDPFVRIGGLPWDQ